MHADATVLTLFGMAETIPGGNAVRSSQEVESCPIGVPLHPQAGSGALPALHGVRCATGRLAGVLPPWQSTCIVLLSEWQLRLRDANG